MLFTDSYAKFASVYDKLINRDYIKMADTVEALFIKHGSGTKLVLDLACGTGSLTVELARRGYDMLGIDLSDDMLAVAKAKAQQYPDIRFLRQDMTRFELYGTVDAVVCTLDAVNYITDVRSLKRLFKLVNNYLNPNGLFIFDINTVYKLKTVLGNNTFVFDEDGIFYTMDCRYFPREKISEQYLTFFVQSQAQYERFDEQHLQRGYETAEIKAFISDAGLRLCEISDWDGKSAVRKCAEKTIFVSKKIC